MGRIQGALYFLLFMSVFSRFSFIYIMEEYYTLNTQDTPGHKNDHDRCLQGTAHCPFPWLKSLGTWSAAVYLDVLVIPGLPTLTAYKPWWGALAS